MGHLSFKDFLTLIEEDAAQDIALLNMQKQKLIVRKSAADQVFDRQINNIDRQLVLKQKQAENEAKHSSATSGSPPTQQPAANKTVTPGSQGAQTPGQQEQSAAPGK